MNSWVVALIAFGSFGVIFGGIVSIMKKLNTLQDEAKQKKKKAKKEWRKFAFHIKKTYFFFSLNAFFFFYQKISVFDWNFEEKGIHAFERGEEKKQTINLYSFFSLHA